VFASPSPIEALNTDGDEDDPFLSSDGRLLLFTSTGSQNADLWTSTRTDASTPWVSPTKLVSFSTGANERAPGLTQNDSVLYFTSDRQNGSIRGWNIYAGTLASGRADLSPLSTTEDDQDPWISPDERLAVVMRGDQLLGQIRDVVGAVWLPPSPLDGVDRSSGCRRPFLSPDGLFLVVARLASGRYQLYAAERSDPGGRFSPLQPLSGLDSEREYTAATLSADGCELLMASRSPGSEEEGPGSSDLSVATRR
jgi:hypothetical protein